MHVDDTSRVKPVCNYNSVEATRILCLPGGQHKKVFAVGGRVHGNCNWRATRRVHWEFARTLPAGANLHCPLWVLPTYMDMDLSSVSPTANVFGRIAIARAHDAVELEPPTVSFPYVAT